MERIKVTRTRILEKGLALMSQSGLSGVTLGMLAERAGLSKSGLFAHFKSKEEVQIELLEHTLQSGRVHIVEPSLREPEGLPRLRALIRNWFGWAPRSGLPGGCPVAAGMFEYDDVESPVRDKIREMESQWREFLTELVKSAVERRHFHTKLDPDQFVWELSGIYLSHHAAQRFLRAPDANQRAERAIESLIERSLAPNDSQLRKG